MLGLMMPDQETTALSRNERNDSGLRSSGFRKSISLPNPEPHLPLPEAV